MITNSYYKPRKNKWHGGHYQHQHQTPTPLALPEPHKPRVDQSAFQDAGRLADAAMRASKLGLSTEEWIRRDDIVKEQQKLCSFRTNDVVYPPDKKGMEKYGKCVIIGRAISYRDMDSSNEWPDNDNPFILTLQTLEKDYPQTVFFSTANWPQKHAPI